MLAHLCVIACLLMLCYVRQLNAMATCYAINVSILDCYAIKVCCRAEWWCGTHPGRVDMHRKVRVAGQVIVPVANILTQVQKMYAYIHQGGHACMHAAELPQPAPKLQ